MNGITEEDEKKGKIKFYDEYKVFNVGEFIIWIIFVCCFTVGFIVIEKHIVTAVILWFVSFVSGASLLILIK